MKKELAKLHCVKHKYPDETEVSACGLEFVVREGEKVALVGGNGSGKTTLILHLLGILNPTEGEVSLLGVDPAKDFSKVGKSVGAVMQRVDDQLVGPTAIDDVKFSLLNYGMSEKEAEKRAEETMRSLGVYEIKDKVIHYLSGGQKKRVAIAGALALHPKILILDEAFNQIDPEGLKKVVETIERLCRDKKMAVVMAVSNREDLEYFEKIFLLKEGKIKFAGSKEEFLSSGIDDQFCSHP